MSDIENYKSLDFTSYKLSFGISRIQQELDSLNSLKCFDIDGDIPNVILTQSERIIFSMELISDEDKNKFNITFELIEKLLLLKD